MKTAGFYKVVLLALLLAFGRPVLAVETISWEGLVPPVDESKNPYLQVPEELQDSLYDLWMVRMGLGSRSTRLVKLEKEAVENFAAVGIDADELMIQLQEFNALMEANNSKLVQDLNGKDVKIPGYVLPTEFSGDKVVEFLLVPYVGACVHTPAPPVNQMVHVKVDKGFTNQGMFAPVWVTGQMKTAMTTQSVALSDGSTEVEAGYQIKASDITPYE